MSTPSQKQITQMLVDWGNGDAAALEKLTPLVYEELHRLARRYMGKERPGHRLQTSAQVNEAYIRLNRLEERRLAEPGSLLCGVGSVDATDTRGLRSFSKLR